MTRSVYTLIGTGLLCAAFQLSAQMPDPPKVLQIVREDIKEGKAGAHQQSEAKVAQLLAKNKFPNYLGMTSMTGPSQAWFLEAYESFASIGEAGASLDKLPEFGTLDALDAEYRNGSRTWMAVYRPDLSYHGAELMAGLPKARYFDIVTIRVRFEHDAEFADLAHTMIDAAGKAGSDQPVAMYQIVSGMPNGTYLLLEPMASLSSLDSGQERSRAIFQAMGDSASKRFLKAAGETIANEEAVLFQIDPRMSNVSKALASGDPEFWNPAPAKATGRKPAAKKAAKKTTAAK